jgi:hypothetical protein
LDTGLIVKEIKCQLKNNCMEEKTLKINCKKGTNKQIIAAQ